MLQCSTAGPLGIVLMRAAVRPLPAAWCCLNPAKRAMQHLLSSSSGRISLLQALWTAGSCQILVVLVQAPSLWPSSVSFPLYPLRGTTHPLETACSIKSTYGLMHLAWNHNIYICRKQQPELVLSEKQKMMCLHHHGAPASSLPWDIALGDESQIALATMGKAWNTNSYFSKLSVLQWHRSDSAY